MTHSCGNSAFEGDPDAALLRAADHVEAGRLDEAEEAYSWAVLSRPDVRVARFELGTLQYMRGLTTRALVTWAPLLDRNDALALYVIAYAALAANDVPSSISAIESGIRIGSGIEPIDANLSILLRELRIHLKEAAPGPAHAEYLVGSYRQSIAVQDL